MLNRKYMVRSIENEPKLVHCSSIVEGKKGDLLCVWYEGAYETSPDTVIKMSTKKRNSPKWSPGRVVLRFPNVPLGNPVLFRDGREMFLIFSFLLRQSWEGSLLCLSRSSGNGETWSDPFIFFPRVGSMAKNRPIKLTTGKWIIPFYNESELCPYVLILDEMKKSLESPYVAETMARGKVMQPAVVEIEPRKLLMFCRSNQGTIWKSISPNGGMTWSICKPTHLPNPYSAVDLIKTRKGDLLLAYNDSRQDRHSLSVALSEDRGKTWTYRRDIERAEEGEYSYPSMIQDSSGRVQLTYTENRCKINHFSFDLEWLREKRLDIPISTD